VVRLAAGFSALRTKLAATIAPPAEPAATEAPARRGLRYPARVLATKKLDSAPFKSGRLLLMITLEEKLAEGEEVSGFLSAREVKTSEQFWLVLTSHQVLKINSTRLATAHVTVESYARAAVDVHKARRRLFGMGGSRLELRIDDRREAYNVKGPQAAEKFTELLRRA
jgi:hypothetical protein